MQIAEAAFRLGNKRWSGLQPKNPFNWGGRLAYTPTQYEAYCAITEKVKRKK